MDEETIYVAVVDGKVSHIYSERPLKFRVVAWESDDMGAVRISQTHRSSTQKDKLINELLHLVNDDPYDEDLLNRLSS